jgi:hypothetical protein
LQLTFRLWPEAQNYDCHGKYRFLPLTLPREPIMGDPASKDQAENPHEKLRRVQQDLEQIAKDVNELLEKIKQIPIDPEEKKSD